MEFKSSVTLEDVFLDEVPIGLADSFQTVDEKISITVRADESKNPGTVVYFGVDLSIGDIGEVKASVISCEQDSDKYNIFLQILELDQRYKDILARTLKGELKDTDDDDSPLWGVGIKQTNGTFAALVNCPAGLLNSDQIQKIANISKQGVGLVKITHAQRLIILLTAEQIESIGKELESVGLRIGVLHAGIRNIRACCGALCQFSQGTDGLSLALEIDKALYGRPMKFDVKIAISDCMRNCLESYCVDIGMIGVKGKYNVYVGGAASSVHYKGLQLISGVPKGELIPLIERILEWYESNAKPSERLYKTLDRLGNKEDISFNNDALFQQVENLFMQFNMESGIKQRLHHEFARGFGLKRMKTDLNL